jgi:cytochrome oxidase Cu insertion factor (SCO1/SenC/PrrC family)
MDSLCRNVCPVEGKEVALAVKPLAPSARPAILIVSVNMADTRATIADAASHWNLPKGYEWLRGTHAQLQRVWSAYHIAVMPTKNGGVVHSDAFYVIDRRGDERAGFLSPFIPGLLTGDLRFLATSAAPART